MGNQEQDINQIIASAVNARVEAAVVEAMSNDETMRTFVSAALNQTVGDYRDKKTLLAHLLQTSIQEQARSVVAEEIALIAPSIRDEVRKALRKSVGVISDSLVDGFVANASGRYPSIEVKFSGRD